MPRSEIAEIDGDQRSACDVFAAPGNRPVPAQAATAWPRVFLAGDWTATGWPATMEGAVRSGYLAAEALARFAASRAPAFSSRSGSEWIDEAVWVSTHLDASVILRLCNPALPSCHSQESSRDRRSNTLCLRHTNRRRRSPP